jgi:sigma-B regulation protein RsbU (phosphoserine phosphatase)
MITQTLSWQEKLAIIDDTMRAISGITDPEEMVRVYWLGIGKLIKVRDYVATTRRGLSAPFYLITRSSRFAERLNPWTQRDRLPRMSGGVLGEIAYADRPLMIYDLPDRLKPDDPAHFYLEGFQSLIALPQYDNGEGLNVTAMLFGPGVEIDHSMLPMLHLQSGLFGRGTQNQVLKNQLAAALADLEAELQVVGDIQRSLLPAELPRIPGFDLAASYRTSARAGGDYYDFFPLADGSWGIFIADVSGHGTPAAVLMAITHAIAHSQPGSHTPPAVLLQYLNEQLTRSYTQAGTFVTAFYAILDPSTRELTYSRAGHNPPRIVRGKRVLALDHNGALPLGILQGEKYGQTVITLEPGDLLLIYTDGITEARSPANSSEGRQFFDTERLDKLLLECVGGSAAACIERIQADLNAFCENAPLTDDQTLIAIHCL